MNRQVQRMVALNVLRDLTMNPLFIFVLAGIGANLPGPTHVGTSTGEQITLKASIYRELLVPWAGNLNGSLLFALHFALLFRIIGFILYRKKIFIKI